MNVKEMIKWFLKNETNWIVSNEFDKNVCSVVEISWIKKYFIDKSKVHTIKENEILQLVFRTNFKLQATYAIKSH